MYKQLDLFKKSQPSDLEILDDMVTPSPDTMQLDWDIQSALDAGDIQRVQELSQMKYDMN
tara:strand:+ start:369 stop:548 length:180 start_codon:yes stop_codon:yes gene_type:complete